MYFSVDHHACSRVGAARRDGTATRQNVLDRRVPSRRAGRLCVAASVISSTLQLLSVASPSRPARRAAPAVCRDL
ncbi:hypothetical protein B5X24_HaOG203978 [Helicoverpa armigera]|uniref:Uncharacterized protein n=1 Tax=Helicoverpa armigera TaxID=29058 RepID=A0A2W1BTG5_HELAM|nr:hypothetical protein B5X24_HaOG203978 [Helicoverpa armigera]